MEIFIPICICVLLGIGSIDVVARIIVYKKLGKRPQLPSVTSEDYYQYWSKFFDYEYEVKKAKNQLGWVGVLVAIILVIGWLIVMIQLASSA